jgi:hypothetical protein
VARCRRPSKVARCRRPSKVACKGHPSMLKHRTTYCWGRQLIAVPAIMIWSHSPPGDHLSLPYPVMSSDVTRVMSSDVTRVMSRLPSRRACPRLLRRREGGVHQSAIYPSFTLPQLCGGQKC